MEILVTTVIIISAGYIFYRNVKKKASGKCECADCGGNCKSCLSYKKE